MALSDRWNNIWQGIGQLGQTRMRGAETFGSGIGGGFAQAGQGIGQGLLERSRQQLQREMPSLNAAAESGLIDKRVSAAIDQLKQSLPLELQQYLEKSNIDVSATKDLRQPQWEQLGYPDFATWREDQLKGKQPDWQQLGFPSLEAWMDFEKSLRAAGKTELGSDEKSTMYQSYLAQIVGQNDDLFMTTNDMGEKVMIPWAEINQKSRDKVLELWRSIIRFEEPAMQAALMDMMETQLGEPYTPLAGETTVSAHDPGRIQSLGRSWGGISESATQTPPTMGGAQSAFPGEEQYYYNQLLDLAKTLRPDSKERIMAEDYANELARKGSTNKLQEILDFIARLKPPADTFSGH